MPEARQGGTLSRVLSPDLDACLCRARSGDGRAFELLFERISPRVEGSLRRFLRSDAGAASAALQDAWSGASQRLSEFESAEHLVCWLHRVAKCKAISGLRKTSRLVTTAWQESSEDGGNLPVPSAPIKTDPGGDSREVLHQAVACLPDTYRGIATLYYLHGQPLREVAQLVCLPVSTVKMRLHRARLRLRRRLRRAPS